MSYRILGILEAIAILCVYFIIAAIFLTLGHFIMQLNTYMFIAYMILVFPPLVVGIPVPRDIVSGRFDILRDEYDL